LWRRSICVRASGEATLAKEVPSSEDRNDHLLHMFGDNCELDLPFLNIRWPEPHRLRENLLVFPVVSVRFYFANLGQKCIWG